MKKSFYLFFTLVVLAVVVEMGYYFYLSNPQLFPSSVEKTPLEDEKQAVSPSDGTTSVKIQYLKDFTQNTVDLGITQEGAVGDGDERTEFTVSGVIVETVEEKDNGFYFPLALKVGKDSSLSNILEVFLGEKGNMVGTNIAVVGIESAEFNAKKVEEVAVLLVPFSQVKLTVVTAYSLQKTQALECNERCKERIALVNLYGKDIETDLLQLKEDKFSLPSKPIGIVSQIVFIQ